MDSYLTDARMWGLVAVVVVVLLAVVSTLRRLRRLAVQTRVDAAHTMADATYQAVLTFQAEERTARAQQQTALTEIHTLVNARLSRALEEIESLKMLLGELLAGGTVTAEMRNKVRQSVAAGEQSVAAAEQPVVTGEQEKKGV